MGRVLAQNVAEDCDPALTTPHANLVRKTPLRLSRRPTDALTAHLAILHRLEHPSVTSARLANSEAALKQPAATALLGSSRQLMGRHRAWIAPLISPVPVALRLVLLALSGATIIRSVPLAICALPEKLAASQDCPSAPRVPPDGFRQKMEPRNACRAPRATTLLIPPPVYPAQSAPTALETAQALALRVRLGSTAVSHPRPHLAAPAWLELLLARSYQALAAVVKMESTPTPGLPRALLATPATIGGATSLRGSLAALVPQEQQVPRKARGSRVLRAIPASTPLSLAHLGAQSACLAPTLLPGA